MINNVTLIGYLGQDPEFRTLESSVAVCRLSLATSKSYKVGEEWKEKTEWHNVILWRGAAEYAQKQLKKGHLVYIEGEINYRKAEKDGSTLYYTDIVASTVRRLTKVEGQNDFIPNEPPESMQASTIPAAAGGTGAPGDDDLPF